MHDSEFDESDSEYDSHDSDSGDSSEYQNMHYTAINVGQCNSRSTDPIKTSLKVQGKKICMEIDTGSGKSLISYRVYKNKFKNIPLEKSNLNEKHSLGKEYICMLVETDKSKKNLQLCVVCEKIQTTQTCWDGTGLKR